MAITLTRPKSRKVGVTSNDTTPDFLLNKIAVGSTKLTVVETNDGGDEDLTLDVDQTNIDHDLLLNFDVNEHFTQAAISVLSTQITDFDEASQDAVGNILLDTASIDFTYDDATPNISAVVLPAGVDHDLLLNFVANEHIDHTAVTLTAGDGLVGGGDISVNRTFDVDINPEALVTAAATDEVLIADASDSFNIKKVTVQSIADLGPGGGGGAVAFAQLSSSVDQEPTVTTPIVITYNTQDDISGITHSTTVDPGEITIDTAGTYYVMPQPQVGKDSGGAAQTLNVYAQLDTGSGFVDVPNSNIKITVSDNTATDVIVSGFTLVLAIGDKIRILQRITNTSVGLGLKFTAAEVGPPTIPATPSIIFTMFRIGA